ncbi:MAG: hypothetical protein AABN95_16015 [Acidobacteriota bacterium]
MKILRIEKQLNPLDWQLVRVSYLDSPFLGHVGRIHRELQSEDGTVYYEVAFLGELDILEHSPVKMEYFTFRKDWVERE